MAEVTIKELNNFEHITIQKSSFRVPVRYAPGPHILTEGEANNLNQSYHEAIRNNMAKKVADGTAAGVSHVALQEQVDHFAHHYTFGSGRRGDPVAVLALNTARERVRQAIKLKGLTEADWPPSRITTAAKALLDTEGPMGSIMTIARQTIQAERAAAKAAMASLEKILAEPTQRAAE